MHPTSHRVVEEGIQHGFVGQEARLDKVLRELGLVVALGRRRGLIRRR